MGIEAIDEMTLSCLATLRAPKYVKSKPFVMQVRPHPLFKPDMKTGSTQTDHSANFQLLDRVIIVSQRYLVPICPRGTVIGRLKQELEILFDEEFVGALPIKGYPKSPNRIYHLHVWVVINLTHGIRLYTEREKPGKQHHYQPETVREPLMKRKSTADAPDNLATTSKLASKKKQNG